MVKRKTLVSTPLLVSLLHRPGSITSLATRTPVPGVPASGSAAAAVPSDDVESALSGDERFGDDADSSPGRIFQIRIRNEFPIGGSPFTKGEGGGNSKAAGGNTMQMRKGPPARRNKAGDPPASVEPQRQPERWLYPALCTLTRKSRAVVASGSSLINGNPSRDQRNGESLRERESSAGTGSPTMDVDDVAAKQQELLEEKLPLLMSINDAAAPLPTTYGVLAEVPSEQVIFAPPGRNKKYPGAPGSADRDQEKQLFITSGPSLFPFLLLDTTCSSAPEEKQSASEAARWPPYSDPSGRDAPDTPYTRAEDYLLPSTLRRVPIYYSEREQEPYYDGLSLLEPEPASSMDTAQASTNIATTVPEQNILITDTQPAVLRMVRLWTLVIENLRASDFDANTGEWLFPQHSEAVVRAVADFSKKEPHVRRAKWSTSPSGGAEPFGPRVDFFSRLEVLSPGDCKSAAGDDNLHQASASSSSQGARPPSDVGAAPGALYHPHIPHTWVAPLRSLSSTLGASSFVQTQATASGGHSGVGIPAAAAAYGSNMRGVRTGVAATTMTGAANSAIPIGGQATQNRGAVRSFTAASPRMFSTPQSDFRAVGRAPPGGVQFEYRRPATTLPSGHARGHSQEWEPKMLPCPGDACPVGSEPGSDRSSTKGLDENAFAAAPQKRRDENPQTSSGSTYASSAKEGAREAERTARTASVRNRSREGASREDAAVRVPGRVVLKTALSPRTGVSTRRERPGVGASSTGTAAQPGGPKTKAPLSPTSAASAAVSPRRPQVERTTGAQRLGHSAGVPVAMGPQQEYEKEGLRRARSQDWAGPSGDTGSSPSSGRVPAIKGLPLGIAAAKNHAEGPAVPKRGISTKREFVSPRQRRNDASAGDHSSSLSARRGTPSTTAATGQRTSSRRGSHSDVARQPGRPSSVHTTPPPSARGAAVSPVNNSEMTTAEVVRRNQVRNRTPTAGADKAAGPDKAERGAAARKGPAEKESTLAFVGRIFGPNGNYSRAGGSSRAASEVVVVPEVVPLLPSGSDVYRSSQASMPDVPSYVEVPALMEQIGAQRKAPPGKEEQEEQCRQKGFRVGERRMYAGAFPMCDPGRSGSHEVPSEALFRDLWWDPYPAKRASVQDGSPGVAQETYCEPVSGFYLPHDFPKDERTEWRPFRTLKEFFQFFGRTFAPSSSLGLASDGVTPVPVWGAPSPSNGSASSSSGDNSKNGWLDDAFFGNFANVQKLQSLLKSKHVSYANIDLAVDDNLHVFAKLIADFERVKINMGALQEKHLARAVYKQRAQREQERYEFRDGPSRSEKNWPLATFSFGFGDLHSDDDDDMDLLSDDADDGDDDEQSFREGQEQQRSAFHGRNLIPAPEGYLQSSNDSPHVTLGRSDAPRENRRRFGGGSHTYSKKTNSLAFSAESSDMVILDFSFDGPGQPPTVFGGSRDYCFAVQQYRAQGVLLSPVGAQDRVVAGSRFPASLLGPSGGSSSGGGSEANFRGMSSSPAAPVQAYTHVGGVFAASRLLFQPLRDALARREMMFLEREQCGEECGSSCGMAMLELPAGERESVSAEAEHEFHYAQRGPRGILQRTTRKKRPDVDPKYLYHTLLDHDRKQSARHADPDILRAIASDTDEFLQLPLQPYRYSAQPRNSRGEALEGFVPVMRK